MRVSQTRTAQTTLALAMLLVCAPGIAQTITIRMINGKSGKPIDCKSLNVEFQGSPAKIALPTDKRGVAHLTLPPGATAISLMAATKKGKLQDFPAYTVCGPFGQFIPIKEILEHGFIPQDACNSTLPPKLTAAPGELLYLVEPLPWYTPAIE